MRTDIPALRHQDSYEKYHKQCRRADPSVRHERCRFVEIRLIHLSRQAPSAERSMVATTGHRLTHSPNTRCLRADSRKGRVRWLRGVHSVLLCLFSCSVDEDGNRLRQGYRSDGARFENNKTPDCSVNLNVCANQFVSVAAAGRRGRCFPGLRLRFPSAFRPAPPLLVLARWVRPNPAGTCPSLGPPGAGQWMDCQQLYSLDIFCRTSRQGPEPE